MEPLERRFIEAALRAENRVEATIVDVEATGDESIEVTYSIAAGDGRTLEAIDRFSIPTVDDPDHDFVALCERVGVPLAAAPEELPGESLEVGTTADGEWTLVPDEQSTSADASRLRVYGRSGLALAHAGYVATVIAFPLLVPALTLSTYREMQTSEDDSPGTFATVVLGLVLVVGVGLLLWWSVVRYLLVFR
ncbi:hypothetical protein [Halopiger goleimassiliensis]|uniref:hypothetical protein n=1 Tax=Halopiger goleimassiliensis TaxID=1293048 RepID=UPI000677E2B2|nr:hypothetical protein [Halopiger goleimassiliensis]